MAQFSYKNFTETDFETIKDSLKNHLKSQDIFKDFDFDGAAINVLLNLLAYNTQYNAYYLNMNAGEKFISHAQKRESVVGLANNLGYVPRSASSPITHVSFDIIPDEGFTDLITIPRNTKFTTVIDGVTYFFLTTEATVHQYDEDTERYHVTELELREGRFFTHRYVKTLGEKFYEIPNKNVDISRLKVYVKDNEFAPDNSKVEYVPYGTIVDVSADSNVYYVQEVDNNKFQIYFGDGVLGKTPIEGNQIIIEYYVTSGAAANGANLFTLDDEFTGLSDIENLTATRASFGADIESTEEVRVNASNNYSTQNRAVVAKDYEYIIKRLIPEISDVSVWGGENAVPKQYGKVFISAIKENSQSLTVIEQETILRELQNNYSVLAITPEFSQTNIVNLILDVLVIKKSSADIGNLELRSLITNALKDNVVNELSKFNANVYESRVEEVVNDSSNQIASNRTRFRMYYNLVEKILINTTNKIVFPTSIQAGSIVSNNFTFSGQTECVIKDNADGTMDIVKGTDIILENAFTVNYTTGEIKQNVTSLLFNLAQLNVRIIASPLNIDVNLTANNIARVNDSDIIVTI